MALSDIFVSDNFNESGGDVNLNVHLPSIGGIWIRNPFYSDNILVNAGNNYLLGPGTSVPIYFNNENPLGPNYSLYGEFFVVSSAVRSLPTICGRVDITHDTYYQLFYDQSDLKLHFWSVVNGVNLELGVSPGTHPINNGETHSFVLEINGSTITARYDGSFDFSFNDTDITAAGKAGVGQGDVGGQQLTTFIATNWGLPFRTTLSSKRV